MLSKIAVISGALLLSLAAFAQNETSSVTVVASRTLDLPIEQVGYSLSVTSPIDATLDQVLEVVQGLGISGKDLTAVSATQQFVAVTSSAPPSTGGPVLVRNFAHTVPFSQLQQTLAKLLAAATPNPDNMSKYTINFYLSSASAAQATVDQVGNGAIPDLIADARTRAKRLADAAGLTLGVILDLTDGRSAGAYVNSPAGIGGISPYYLGGFSSPKLTASVTVRFALVRYNNPY